MISENSKYINILFLIIFLKDNSRRICNRVVQNNVTYLLLIKMVGSYVYRGGFNYFFDKIILTFFFNFFLMMFIISLCIIVARFVFEYSVLWQWIQAYIMWWSMGIIQIQQLFNFHWPSWMLSSGKVHDG